jgi:hypothetical protein
MARTTIAIVVLFFALAGSVWAWDRINGTPSTDTQVYVQNIKDADVQRIDVQTAAGTTSFERAEPVGWKFVSNQEPADLSKVNSVVTRLSKLRSSAKVTDRVGELGTYGLAPPADTATLTMKDGVVHRVLVGAKTPNDSAYYTMVEGKTELHTINTLLVGDLEKLVTEPPLQTTPTPAGAAAAPPTPAEPTPTIAIPAIRTEP